MRPFRFGGYASSAAEPNVVVDGSPNESTVLTLTHWPGYPQPPGYHFDLSAEMAFHYLDDPIDHPPAEVATNNHFDQDGLVGLHALIEPELARQHRSLLIDVAAAGDFGTYRDRRAARASMAIATYADAERSPLADRLGDDEVHELGDRRVLVAHARGVDSRGVQHRDEIAGNRHAPG